MTEVYVAYDRPELEWALAHWLPTRRYSGRYRVRMARWWIRLAIFLHIKARPETVYVQDRENIIAAREREANAALALADPAFAALLGIIQDDRVPDGWRTDNDVVWMAWNGEYMTYGRKDGTTFKRFGKAN